MHNATLLVALSFIFSTALAATTASGCSISNGQNGVCISTGSCNSSGGKSQAGHCPGAADIQVHLLLPFILIDRKTDTMNKVLHLRQLYCLRCCRTLPAHKLMQSQIDRRTMPWPIRYSMLSWLRRIKPNALRNTDSQCSNSDIDQEF
jgi:hypothetical protein